MALLHKGRVYVDAICTLYPDTGKSGCGDEEEETDKKLLYEEIAKLNGRDKLIMILRYGLYNTQEMTQKDVANLLGISQSYISRIEK